jgi:hypothetical protein
MARRCPDIPGSYRSPDTTDGDGHRAVQDSLRAKLVETTINGGSKLPRVFIFAGIGVPPRK